MILDAIGLVSRDLKKSKEFYSFFGLEFKQVGGEDHLEASLSTGQRLMIDSESLMKKINPSWKRSHNTSMSLCFKQESSEAVNEICEKLKEKGYELVKEPWDAFWGQRYSSFLDPDGNQIDIFSDLS